MQPELGKVIAQMRGEREFSSREELANAAGVATKTVDRIENGEKFQQRSLAAIASALDYTTEEITNRALELRRVGRSKNPPKTPYFDTVIRADTSDLSQMFADLDEAVQEEFGDLYSQTQGTEVDYSSRRLFTSLSMIDIPPEIALHVTVHLPEALREVMPDGRFDTGDIRLAVSQVISNMPLSAFGDGRAVLEEDRSSPLKSPKERLEIWETKKADWAKRYSRRFGDPNRAIQILHQNGDISPLDYKFLKKTLVPHMLDRLLDDRFRNANDRIVSSQMIGQMSEFLLKEFRRLGLYSLRYKTALQLAEDTATQPPHPWLVTEDTRTDTINYDLERAEAHFQKLSKSRGELDHDDWHRFSELVHHSCSAILGVYSGFMGHDYLMSLRLLMQWLTIQERNFVLWSFCDLRFIDEDLTAIGSSKDDLYRFLHSVDVRIKSHQLDSVEEALKICLRIKNYAHQLFDRRESMIRMRHELDGSSPVPLADLVAIVRENMIATFIHCKPRDVTNRDTQDVTGFTASLDFNGSPFENRPSFCIVSVYDNCDDKRTFEDSVAETIDLIRGHRLTQLGFMVCRNELSNEQAEYLKTQNEIAGPGIDVFCIPLSGLMQNAREKRPSDLFFDLVLDHM